ncbi:MAG TPA: hypothetical protein VGM22_09095 [Methylomirabilota bacterium]|jgi:hypothetical protein
MWLRRLAVAAVIVTVVLLATYPVWRENERRYADLRLTGCFGDTGVPGVSQECTGNVRRLCRDAPPLIDWRRFCR